MSEAHPQPTVNADSAPYWAAANEERLIIQQCLDCNHRFFLPGHLCPSCWSDKKEWIDTEGTAKRDARERRIDIDAVKLGMAVGHAAFTDDDLKHAIALQVGNQWCGMNIILSVEGGQHASVTRDAIHPASPRLMSCAAPLAGFAVGMLRRASLTSDPQNPTENSKPGVPSATATSTSESMKVPSVFQFFPMSLTTPSPDESRSSSGCAMAT